MGDSKNQQLAVSDDIHQTLGKPEKNLRPDAFILRWRDLWISFDVFRRCPDFGEKAVAEAIDASRRNRKSLREARLQRRHETAIASALTSLEARENFVRRALNQVFHRATAGSVAQLPQPTDAPSSGDISSKLSRRRLASAARDSMRRVSASAAISSSVRSMAKILTEPWRECGHNVLRRGHWTPCLAVDPHM
jgi:hypothetical protein